MTDVMVLGIAVMDFVLYVDAFPAAAEKYRARDAATVSGGCGGNAAVAIARLGGRAHLAARLGDDAVADLIAGDLSAEDVEISLLHRAESGRSSFSSILVDSFGERQIVNFRGSGLIDSTDWLVPPSQVAAVLADTRWPAGTRHLMRLARERGVPGVVDAEAPLNREDLSDASHVTFSAQGLRSLYPGADLAGALADYRVSHGGWCCVTDGARGVLYDSPKGRGQVPAFPVRAVDTLGAGDVWHGAFALRLAEGAAELDAVRFANAAAAIKCARLGGRAGSPTRDEVDRLVEGAERCN